MTKLLFKHVFSLLTHSCLGRQGVHYDVFLCDFLGRIISLSWHPSGTLIAAGMMDMIRIFDAETGK